MLGITFHIEYRVKGHLIYHETSLRRVVKSTLNLYIIKRAVVLLPLIT